MSSPNTATSSLSSLFLRASAGLRSQVFITTPRNGNPPTVLGSRTLIKKPIALSPSHKNNVPSSLPACICFATFTLRSFFCASVAARLSAAIFLASCASIIGSIMSAEFIIFLAILLKLGIIAVS